MGNSMTQEDKLKMLEGLMNQFEAHPSIRFDLAPEIIQGYKDLLSLVKMQREVLQFIVTLPLECAGCKVKELAQRALEWEG